MQPSHVSPGLRRAAFALVLISGAAATAQAQGTLSGQGLGYPQGQLSTRALATGGALAETDPASPVNPSSLIGFGTTTLYFQIEPEYRTVEQGGVTERTSQTRHPLMTAAIQAGDKWVFSIATSSLLDRTWATTISQTDTLAGEPIPSTVRYRVLGSINDLRLASAYVPRSWLRLGLGVHLLSGGNQIRVIRAFQDTSTFAAFGNEWDVSYGGTAASAGVNIIIPGGIAAGASARFGGSLTATRNDSVLGRGEAPSRFGIGLAYIGFSNATISARTSRERWSDLTGLTVTPGAAPHDAWDSAVGADVAGPRFGSSALLLRGGYRWRTLPFDAAGSEVRERTLSLGLGAQLVNGHAGLDLAVLRANRTAAAASESAWTLSVGVTVRP